MERLFKSGAFPPTIHKGLEEMLDKIGETPLVVRSSSLLEDRIGHAFSGKYKSLFIANRGALEMRLDASSRMPSPRSTPRIFHPDPIEYRRERGLIDFQEQMGILIQEVVGARSVGMLLPVFAGVAFSRCEMRWSPRIRRTDGMARTGPGARHPGGGPHRRRLPGAGGSGAANPARHPAAGGDLPLLPARGRRGRSREGQFESLPWSGPHAAGRPQAAHHEPDLLHLPRPPDPAHGRDHGAGGSATSWW